MSTLWEFLFPLFSALTAFFPLFGALAIFVIIEVVAWHRRRKMQGEFDALVKKISGKSKENTA